MTIHDTPTPPASTEEKEPYPQHAILREHGHRTQSAFEFVQFLNNKGIVLAQWRTVGGYDELRYMQQSLDDVLAEWIGLDRQKLSEEKDALYQQLRAANQP